MTDDRLKYLLERYLDQSATEEELQEYAAWYRETGGGGEPLFEDTGEARKYSNSLFRSIMGEVRSMEKKHRLPAPPPWLNPVRWVAAAALVGMGSFFLLHTIRTVPANPGNRNRPVSDLVEKNVIAFKNHSLEASTLYLQDGSLVVLWPGSELRYEQPFDAVHRKVYLAGKGYFKVNGSPARPFTVYTHHTAATALGTSFTISAFPGGKEVTVHLHTGKVMIQQLSKNGLAQGKDIYLLPGQVVACNALTGLPAWPRKPGKAVYEADRERSAGSRTGFAAGFDQEPMARVLDTIAKGYSVRLVYDKKELADLLFSGKIRETDSLQQVLNRIAVLYDLTVKATGNKYIIQKNH